MKVKTTTNGLAADKSSLNNAKLIKAEKAEQKESKKILLNSARLAKAKGALSLCVINGEVLFDETKKIDKL